MKRIVVLLAVAALFAAPAFGAVRNSKHDLSSTSTASIKSNNVDEVCVFCHTPHGGVTGILAPLWNRSIPGGSVATADLYNSATLDQANSNPTTVATVVNNSDAPLCMSCHDGGSLAGGLNNPPASASNAQPAFTGTGAGVDAVSAIANVFGDTLKNDHPIGMDYSAVQGLDTTGFNAANAGDTAVDFGANSLPLYTSTGVMWCSTCHDVHGEGGGSPFLNAPNTGSALCTTCHVK